MTDKRTVLIFVPPGYRRPIKKFLEKLLPDAIVKNIEEIMLNSLETQLKKKEIIVAKMNMHEALSRFTRDYLKKEWKKAIETIDTSLNTESSETVIIIAQLIYYSNARNEFYPMVDVGYLNETFLNISHVVLIIDDIFDIYKELSKESTELFGETTFRYFIESYKKNRGISDGVKKLNSVVHLTWLSYCLNSILNWRAQEVTVAQSTASQIKCEKFIVWGLKQDPLTLKNWIMEKEKDLVYISHPITEPRQQYKNLSNSAVVNIVNNTQERLRQHHIMSIMPTAIDELRFKKLARKNTPILLKRWPVPTKTTKILSKYSLLKNDYHNLQIFYPRKIDLTNSKKLLKPGSVNSIKAEADGIISTLESMIQEQVSNRDHLLVWYTSAIIVIEPWSQKHKRLHGGVEMELKYLREINDNIRTFEDKAKQKKLVVIYTKDSIRSIIKHYSFQESARQLMAEIVSKRHGIEPNDMLRSLDKKLNISKMVSALGRRIPPPQMNSIKNDLPNLTRLMCKKAFLRTGLPLAEEQAPIAVYIVKKLDDVTSTKILSKIKKFIKSNVSDNAWENDIVQSVRMAGYKIQ